ncbi:hypothetical protein [Streptomyces sp. RB17]|uniref:hypothetical protein n=1 Tax=Streptomyces sp. RB17 TaxID=2585197 RepID=UPI0012955B4B|nr:hypothetical protein [Streptomyces sp. RB17]
MHDDPRAGVGNREVGADDGGVGIQEILRRMAGGGDRTDGRTRPMRPQSIDRGGIRHHRSLPRQAGDRTSGRPGVRDSVHPPPAAATDASSR